MAATHRATKNDDSAGFKSLEKNDPLEIMLQSFKMIDPESDLNRIFDGS